MSIVLGQAGIDHGINAIEHDLNIPPDKLAIEDAPSKALGAPSKIGTHFPSAQEGEIPAQLCDVVDAETHQLTAPLDESVDQANTSTPEPESAPADDKSLGEEPSAMLDEHVENLKVMIGMQSPQRGAQRSPGRFAIFSRNKKEAAATSKQVAMNMEVIQMNTDGITEIDTKLSVAMAEMEAKLMEAMVATTDDCMVCDLVTPHAN